MSVDYNSYIAIGWAFTSEEHSAFNQITDYKYEDNFLFVNAYDPDEDVIFGIAVSHCGEGKYESIRWYNDNKGIQEAIQDLSEEYGGVILSYFPEKFDHLDTFLINAVT